MNKTRLRKYAALIAKCGVNVQKKQDVIITAELDQPEFVEMLVKECYKLGAKKVYVDWTHQPLTALNVKYCTERHSESSRTGRSRSGNGRQTPSRVKFI